MQQATVAIRAGVPLAVLSDTIQPFPAFSEIFYFALAELTSQVPAGAHDAMAARATEGRRRCRRRVAVGVGPDFELPTTPATDAGSPNSWAATPPCSSSTAAGGARRSRRSSAASRTAGRGGGRVLALPVGQRRLARGQRRVPGGPGSTMDVPVRRRPRGREAAGAARDHRHAQRSVRPCRVRARPGPARSTAPTTATGSGAGPPLDELVADLRAITSESCARLGRADAMSRCWLAIVDVHQRGADGDAAAAGTTATAQPAASLAAWNRGAKARSQRPARRRAHRRPARRSRVDLARARRPRACELAFDDLAVQQARRDVLAASHAGRRVDAAPRRLALRGRDHASRAAPRAAAPPRRSVRPRSSRRAAASSEPGSSGAAPPPVGPTIERYGSANPWPWDRFG